MVILTRRSFCYFTFFFLQRRLDVIAVVPDSDSVYNIRAVKIGNAILKVNQIILLL